MFTRGVVKKLEATPWSHVRALWRETLGAIESISVPTLTFAKEEEDLIPWAAHNDFMIRFTKLPVMASLFGFLSFRWNKTTHALVFCLYITTLSFLSCPSIHLVGSCLSSALFCCFFALKVIPPLKSITKQKNFGFTFQSLSNFFNVMHSNLDYLPENCSTWQD